MKERPILFSAPMVRALLAGTKTQTRRAIKLQTGETFDEHALVGAIQEWRQVFDKVAQSNVGRRAALIRCPYGVPGDQLWVRETFWAFGRWETRFSEKKGRDEWHFVDMTAECGLTHGFAEQLRFAEMRKLAPRGGASPCWWKRPAIHMPRAASRIQLDVTGVRVERLWEISEEDARAEGWDGTVLGYAKLWETINGPGSWDANPWVWVIEFRRTAA